MQKFLLSAALVCGIFFNASAQNTKTKAKTTTTPAGSTTTINQTSQDNNAGTVEQTTTTTSSSGGSLRFQSSSNGGSDMKAAGGEITLEANVNPFAGNQVSLSNSLNQVRVRYFLADDLAARLGAHLSFNTNTPNSDTNLTLTLAAGLIVLRS